MGVLDLVAIGGVVAGGIIFKDEIIEIINKYLDGGGPGPTPCTKTCAVGQHLDTATCTCIPDACTKVCVAPQILNGATCTCYTPAPIPSSGNDKFGIKMLNTTIPSGRTWFSKWDNGHARSWVSKGISQRNPDPDDPESDLHANTNGSKCSVDGHGKMVMEGSNPRLYINSPNSNGVKTANNSPKWQNVEMTIYFKCLKADPRGSISVFSRLAARSEHQLEYTCGGGGRTMGAFEIKSNGTVQLRKEWWHDSYAPNIISSVKSPPRGVRWGMKLVLRNVGNNILSQCYIDTTNGQNGGDWQKVIERLDKAPPAQPSTDLCHKYSGDFVWLGPATSCYLRCDGNFTEFDSFSIREIAPLSSASLGRAIGRRIAMPAFIPRRVAV